MSLKWLASLQSGEAITSESIRPDGSYPVFGGNGLRGYSDAYTHEGAFVLIGRQGALCGNINFAEGKFWASEHAVVVSPREPVNVRWLGELLRVMNLNQHSVAAAQPGLAVERIVDLQIPVPPLAVQHAIGSAVDRETARIDALIKKKTRFIELLREKRQASITSAVTKGIDPGAAMKQSGDDWLGDVAAHWRLVRFQRVVYVAEGQVDPEVEPYRSMTLLAPNHVESATGRILYTESAADQGAESGKYLCSAGDVVYSKIRPALRKVCLAPEPCLCSADMYPLQGREGLGNQFLLWYLLSEPFSAFAVLEAERVAMPKINRESLAQLLMAVPPEPEQVAICDHLKVATARMDALLSTTQRSIDLLKERRAALITAAVTGQIDVRAEVRAEETEPA